MVMWCMLKPRAIQHTHTNTYTTAHPPPCIFMTKYIPMTNSNTPGQAAWVSVLAKYQTQSPLYTAPNPCAAPAAQSERGSAVAWIPQMRARHVVGCVDCQQQAGHRIQRGGRLILSWQPSVCVGVVLLCVYVCGELVVWLVVLLHVMMMLLLLVERGMTGRATLIWLFFMCVCTCEHTPCATHPHTPTPATHASLALVSVQPHESPSIVIAQGL